MPIQTQPSAISIYAYIKFIGMINITKIIVIKMSTVFQIKYKYVLTSYNDALDSVIN